MSNEKRKVGNYEVIACQRIGGEEIIVAEDKNAMPSERYLCCYVERNELMELYTHGLASDGYAEFLKYTVSALLRRQRMPSKKPMKKKRLSAARTELSP